MAAKTTFADLLNEANKRKGIVGPIAVRAKYAADHMIDVPPIYCDLLPMTDDVDKLEEAELAIRKKFDSDFKGFSKMNHGDHPHVADNIGKKESSKESSRDALLRGLKELKPENQVERKPLIPG